MSFNENYSFIDFFKIFKYLIQNGKKNQINSKLYSSIQKVVFMINFLEKKK